MPRFFLSAFQIRRPYFHVKPLEKSQLKCWREYLDFEIAHGSHERALVLFERCLIACALYEEFWLKVMLLLSCTSMVFLKVGESVVMKEVLKQSFWEFGKRESADTGEDGWTSDAGLGICHQLWYDKRVILCSVIGSRLF